jgi:uncharacterized repeat protein (TIGR02543 family)
VDYYEASLFWTPDSFAGTTNYVRRDGYVFGGWWTASSGGTQVTDGQTTGPKTLYAHWNVTVSFETYYQYTGYSTPSQSVAQGGSITLPTPSKSGFTFVYWSTQSQPSSGGKNGSYDVGVGGSSYTPTGNVTLYACWTTSVKFDPNGGEVYHPRPSSGTPYWSSTVVVNFSAASLFWVPDHITNNALVKRAGYAFAGWWTDPSGGTQVTDGQTTGPKTWYAHWTKVYTLKLYGNGGTFGGLEEYLFAGLEGHAYIDSEIPKPTRAKYKFVGWYDAASGGNKILGTGWKCLWSLSAYAHWELDLIGSKSVSAASSAAPYVTIPDDNNPDNVKAMIISGVGEGNLNGGDIAATLGANAVDDKKFMGSSPTKIEYVFTLLFAEAAAVSVVICGYLLGERRKRNKTLSQ